MLRDDVRPRALVDVGIPTLGESPRYLAEAVESVLGQTLSDWRLVISENGTGKTEVRSMLEPYLDDPRVHHVVTTKSLGRGQHWSNIVRNGSAPFVGLLHDDDRWAPEFLRRRIEFLRQHPSCGFVFAEYVIIDEFGKPKGRVKPFLDPGLYASEFILPTLYRRNFVGVPTVLMRRSAYDTVGAAFKEHINLDHEMWLRLSAYFDVGCLDGWDADYRHHPAQTSSARATLAQKYLESLDLVSDLPLRRSLRREVRAEAHVRCALDAVERGERRAAIGHLGTAVRSDAGCVIRWTVVNRILAALAAIVAGAYGRRTLTRIRQRRWETGGAEGLMPIPAARSRGTVPRR